MGETAMLSYLRRSWSVVNLDAIAHNVHALQARLSSPDCKLMGVVKADAYGHGDKFVTDQLVRLGVRWFGVSNLEEALSLRMQGIFHPILIFGFTPADQVGLLGEYNLTQTVYSLEYGRSLQVAAEEADVTVNVHIKVDTGMSRLGFILTGQYFAEAVSEITQVCSLPRLHAEGIYTHFASADELTGDGEEFTRSQFRLFQNTVEELEARGLRFALRHCCNSAATINYPEMHLDMVRPGIALYGLAPSADCAGKLDLRPAMELFSTIAQVKTVPSGAVVSYGRCYTARRDTVIAAVAIGYADGFERELSNKARVLIRGSYAKVIGRVCMDQLMLDVTHIPGVQAGDLVTIVGADGEGSLTFDEMARLSGTISYEKICLIGKRVPRIYRRGGKDVGVADYVHRQKE